MRLAFIPGRFDATEDQQDEAIDNFPNAWVRALTEARGDDLTGFGAGVVRNGDVALLFRTAITSSVRRLTPTENVTNLPFTRSENGWGVASALHTTRDGTRVIYSVGHTPAHHIIGRNRRAWIDGIRGWADHIADLEERFPGVPIVIIADWNRRLTKRNRRKIQAMFPPGFHFTWNTHPPNRGTRGKNVIDGVLVKGLTVDDTHVYPATPGYDHRPSTHDLSPKENPMPTSQNGWPALDSDSDLLYTWVIPARTGDSRIRLRNGSAGFLLVHMLLWFAEAIEPLLGKVLDDWGYAFRPIRQSTELSNHAAGCAADANATQHPLGVEGTFTKAEAAKIRRRLKLYRGVIRWGGDFNGRKDDMHFEINKSLASAERVAKLLMLTPRGRRILKANPGQDAVIRS